MSHANMTPEQLKQYKEKVMPTPDQMIQQPTPEMTKRFKDLLEQIEAIPQPPAGTQVLIQQRVYDAIMTPVDELLGTTGCIVNASTKPGYDPLDPFKR